MNKLISDVAFGHFRYLPQLGGYNVTKQDGLYIINCGFDTSMFNIVCGPMTVKKCEAEKAIYNIISKFNGQPFALWLPPDEYPLDLIDIFQANGFIIEAPEHAMICDLANFKHTIEDDELSFGQVKNEEDLNYFLSILEPYDHSARIFYEKLSVNNLLKQEKLFVAMRNGVPVTIGILYFHRNAAGIFCLITPEQFRGRGYGTNMMRFLLQTAKTSGSKYVTLSASSDSGFRIYKKLGFKVHGKFLCFEWDQVG